MVLAAVVGGCWTDHLVDGFSPDQWRDLQETYRFSPAGSYCPSGINPPCEEMARFGQALFFDKQLSRAPGRPGTESCASCHDAKNWFIDTRQPNDVSLTANLMDWTKRNSMTLVDAALKEDFAPPGANVFTWGTAPPDGPFPTAGSVLDIAIRKAMKSTHAELATTIRDTYGATFASVFGVDPTQLDDETVFAKIELAFDAYLRRLVSAGSPFDHYLAGNASAMPEAAKRGFRVFVGPGGCAECHRGALLSDLAPHSTGVAPGAVADAGFGDGTFITATLRQVAKTGPYMHDGKYATLGDVIAFYRRGGDDAGFPKDPRIVPLDITDDDAADLEAFLEALTGEQVPADLTCAGPPCT